MTINLRVEYADGLLDAVWTFSAIPSAGDKIHVFRNLDIEILEVLYIKHHPQPARPELKPGPPALAVVVRNYGWIDGD
ncbi:hypothetical protein ACELLULO517_07560 [Acidisoma cellulosilytica]|uniref:Uncharacterized protein n=1 Tax=Acidisoma cellulosilyticum TaxID=2802395 RepID=A0A963YZJ4_9PROT|nr:hypothetical protein [Acidisoma cellulosilyticum]MCB8880087.1 hypothetical protein [Acidisoma cellulosilyticum]